MQKKDTESYASLKLRTTKGEEIFNAFTRNRLNVLRRLKPCATISDGDCRRLPHRSMVQLPSVNHNFSEFLLFQARCSDPLATELNLSLFVKNEKERIWYQIYSVFWVVISKPIPPNITVEARTNNTTKHISTLDSLLSKKHHKFFQFSPVEPGDVLEIVLKSKEGLIDRVSANLGLKKTA